MNGRTILIVGGGEFGSCLAGILKKNCTVHVWDSDSSKRSDALGLDAMCSRSSVVFLCVCSWHVIDAMESLRPFLRSDILIVSCVKGLLENGLTIDKTVRNMFPDNRFAIFSGPTIAEDMCRGLPGTAAVAGASADFDTVRELFSGTNISVVYEPDLYSVAWAGVLKNIYSLFIGMADGAGLYAGNERLWENLIYSEWNMLAQKFDIEQSVLGGITGKEDFEATASSEHSANRAFGYSLGSGAEPEKDCEGMHSLNALVGTFEREHTPPPRLLAAMRAITLQPRDAHTILSSLV